VKGTFGKRMYSPPDELPDDIREANLEDGIIDFFEKINSGEIDNIDLIEGQYCEYEGDLRERYDKELERDGKPPRWSVFTYNSLSPEKIEEKYPKDADGIPVITGQVRTSVHEYRWDSEKGDLLERNSICKRNTFMVLNPTGDSFYGTCFRVKYPDGTILERPAKELAATSRIVSKVEEG